MAPRIACVCSLGLAALSCAQPTPSGTARVAVDTPATPAGRALAAWLRVYNLGNLDSGRAFAEEAYSKAELAERSAELIARGQRLWLMNYGAMRLVSVDSSGPHALEATVHEALTDAFGKVFVEVDSVPPYGISGVWLIPFVPPPPGSRTPRLADDALAAALDQYAARLAEHDVLSGAVLVARQGRPIFAQAYGLADRDPAMPNTLETRFELASLSKLFTAVAVAQLVEQGRLSFQESVAEALPDYPNVEVGRRVTIHHLLTHTSGLPDYYRNGKYRQFEDSIRTLRDFWRTFAQDSLWSEPGARFDYSNSNYILLGSIVEQASGMPFETYVQRHIFEPAGMTSTCYCEPGAPRYATPQSRYTAGFGPGRRPVIERWVEVPAGAKRPGAPGGGGISTVGDLVRFGQALLDHRLLTERMTALVLAPKVPTDDGGSRGYGFEVNEWSGTRVVGHGGNFWGSMSQLDIYPESGYTVVVLSNNDASGGEAIRNWTRAHLTIR
ncbi:MAG TPA: serine hydrolase domain-containing protein [Gemmatimonadales bacterium]|nr:serine hydrolase domain-containing protein [Gemmatimonadales bacterium]